MVVERHDMSVHISKGEATWALVTGVVLGVGIIEPVFAGIGLFMAGLGALRVNGRESREQLKILSDYISKSIK